MEVDVFEVTVWSSGVMMIFDSQEEYAKGVHYLLMEKIVNWVKTLDLNNLVWNPDDIDELLEERPQVMVDPPEWISNMLEKE